MTKGFKMQAVFYSQARNNLREIINKVCDDFDEYIITTKDEKSVVLISYEEYSSMKETIYLLSSKNNRDRLNNAVEQIENSKFLKKEIENSVIIIISDADQKPMITVGVSQDLESKYHAGNIVKELAKEIQGGGGGNPGFATAGGKNLAGIDAALAKALEL